MTDAAEYGSYIHHTLWMSASHASYAVQSHACIVYKHYLPQEQSIYSGAYAEPSQPELLPVPSEKNVHSENSSCADAGIYAPYPCNVERHQGTAASRKCTFISLAETSPWARIAQPNIA